MIYVGLVLFIVCLGSLFVGLIIPRAFRWLFREVPSRRMIVVIFSFAALVSLAVIGATIPEEDLARLAAERAVRDSIKAVKQARPDPIKAKRAARDSVSEQQAAGSSMTWAERKDSWTALAEREAKNPLYYDKSFRMDAVVATLSSDTARFGNMAKLNWEKKAALDGRLFWIGNNHNKSIIVTVGPDEIGIMHLAETRSEIPVVVGAISCVNAIAFPSLQDSVDALLVKTMIPMGIAQAGQGVSMLLDQRRIEYRMDTTLCYMSIYTIKAGQ